MPKETKLIKALDDLGRERIMEIDLMNGEVISSKLLRKKKGKEINVADDLMLGVDFK